MVPRKWLSPGDWASIPAGAEYELEGRPGGVRVEVQATGSVRDRCRPDRADYPD